MVSVYRSVSVCTLLRGRQEHFDHLVAGLRAQTLAPDELVVAYMQDEPPEMSGDCAFPVRMRRVPGEPMPLAAARNAAADAASGDVLAFLDVDCIPDKDFVRRAGEAASTDGEGVYLPEVRYLPGEPGGWLDPAARIPDYPRLERRGCRHPSKQPLAGCSTSPIHDFGELWGLAFILARDTWHAAGGMDEDYVGYGAEETDFGRRLRHSGARLYWLGGTICYHQHHHVHNPPLQHFDSILRNASLFQRKWGERCMEYWIDDFKRRGLVERSDSELIVLRRPTSMEIAETRQGPEVLFS